ncbi:MAG: intradiol ring-cleavage dioxygenase [Methylobacteriaceae bacterium]|nr:intradiol ring-cleavage dioxygenase [Methylobacteriaceae bacterium]
MKRADRFPSRRQLLAEGVVGIPGLILAGGAALAEQRLAPTPACHDGDEPTIAETEGPFFKPRSPQRSDLREPGIEGDAVELFGYVLTRACRPLAGALVDLWHADSNGDYDNTGFRLRGHVFTDTDGRFAFRTIMPGLYPGRTRHYHVKVQAPGRSRMLTTQFYFPNERRNRTDGLFRRELVMQIAEAGHGLLARFDVVL